MPRITREQLVRRYSVHLERRVEWGDMDVFRHVNNTVFFGYFESVRIEYLVRIGFDGEGASPCGPILASTHCRFRMPLRYPDRISIGARTTELRDDRFVMEYQVVSHEHDRVAAEGGGVIVSYDYRAQGKAPLPEAVRARIVALDGADLAGWTCESLRRRVEVL